MKNRSGSTIKSLTPEIIANILEYTSIVSILGNLNIITNKDKNPFLSNHSNFNAQYEQAMWKRFSYLHFPHFTNGLSHISKVEDWKRFFIECCDNSQKAFYDTKYVRSIKLFMFAREGNIDGMISENVQFQDLEISFFEDTQKFYEVVYGNQVLSDYLYSEVVMQAYSKKLMHPKQLLFWAIVFSQSLADLDKSNPEVRESCAFTSHDELFREASMKAAIKFDNFPAIKYLWNSAAAAVNSNINFKYFELICSVSAKCSLETVKEVCENSNELIQENDYVDILLSGVQNKNSGVFSYLYQKFWVKEIAPSDVSLMFQYAIEYGSIENFKLLHGAYKGSDAVVQLQAYFLKILQNTIGNPDLYLGDNDWVEKIRYFLLNLLDIVPNESINYRYQLEDLIIKKVRAPIFEDFLKLIFDLQKKEFSPDNFFHSLIDSILNNPASDTNPYAIHLIFDRFYKYLNAQQKHQLFVYSLLSGQLVLIKEMYSVMSNDQSLQFSLDQLKLNDRNFSKILSRFPRVMEFLLATEYLSFSYSVFQAAAAGEVDIDLFKRFVLSQSSFYPESIDEYIFNLLNESRIKNHSSLMVYLLSAFSDCTTLPAFFRKMGHQMSVDLLLKMIESKVPEIGAIKALLHGGVDPNLRYDTSKHDNPGWYVSDLFYPAQENYHFLLNKIARIYFKNPLFKNNAELFNVVVAAGADIDKAFSVVSPLSYEQFKIFLSHGANPNKLDENGNVALVRVLLASPRILGEIKKQVDLLLQHGVDVKLALSGIYCSHIKTSAIYWDRNSLYGFEYLLDLLHKSPGLNQDVGMIANLFEYIKNVLLRSDNDRKVSFKIFGQVIAPPGQRSALEKKKAADLLLGVFLGVNEHASLKICEADLTQGELGKIYLSWLNLNNLDPNFLSKIGNRLN